MIITDKRGKNFKFYNATGGFKIRHVAYNNVDSSESSNKAQENEKLNIFYLMASALLYRMVQGGNLSTGKVFILISVRLIFHFFLHIIQVRNSGAVPYTSDFVTETP